MDEQKQPQLVMTRRQVNDLPAVSLPPDCLCRPFEPGDERSWETIINDAFGGTSDFIRFMAGSPAFKPERVWFICCGEKPVATASAWLMPAYGEACGYLHMVGVMKEHSGRGLGLQVSLAALHQMLKEGRSHAVLETDDFRIPAIKTYFKLDFVPMLTHDSHEQRWSRIYKILCREPAAFVHS
jgi:mycothiol synthase